MVLVKSTLQDKLRAGRFVITAEVTPPVSADRGELLAKALPLKGLADAVNITDGAGARPHLGAVTAAALLVEAGIEPVLQLTCRDRNRIALQSDLLSAAACGVRNLLMLRGDDPSAGDQPDAKAVFDLDPRSLLETARRLRDTRRIALGPQDHRPRRFFPRQRRQSDRSAGRLAARPVSTPRSKPARNSCRRSSAWMPASCAATWRGSPSRASPIKCRC